MFCKKLKIFSEYNIGDKIVFENTIGQLSFGVIKGFTELGYTLGLYIHDISRNDFYTIESKQVLMIVK
jgi:hypothetical protein